MMEKIIWTANVRNEEVVQELKLREMS